MIVRQIKNFYAKYERHISSLSLISGFIFDIFTLKRVDLFWENLWVGAHLVVAAAAIIVLNIFENSRKKISQERFDKVHFWLIIIIQFAFGGLLSTFLVFYFRSASLVTSWPFMLLLAFVFISNELFKKHYSRLTFQTVVLFVCIYSFAIFIVPVIVHDIGPIVFLLSGAVSVAALGIFIIGLRLISKERFKESRRILLASVVGILALVNLLYFTKSIPPIPLSLKDAGVYHDITKDSFGNYVVKSERYTWQDYFKSSELVRTTMGQPVYVYTAIFSPTLLNTSIVHVWQYYDEAKKSWIASGRVRLPIVGGRDGGFRTYSVKGSVFPGQWRVDVETLQGLKIGRVRFTIVDASTTPDLAIQLL